MGRTRGTHLFFVFFSGQNRALFKDATVFPCKTWDDDPTKKLFLFNGKDQRDSCFGINMKASSLQNEWIFQRIQHKDLQQLWRMWRQKWCGGFSMFLILLTLRKSKPYRAKVVTSHCHRGLSQRATEKFEQQFVVLSNRTACLYQSILVYIYIYIYPYAPWRRNIYLHSGHKKVVNVGKYTIHVALGDHGE